MEETKENKQNKTEKREITVYDAEDIVSEIMKVAHYTRWKDDEECPEIIRKNYQRLFDELVERYPRIDKAYEEYKMIKEKSAFKIVEMALAEENDIEIEYEDGTKEHHTDYVYKVINKKCKKNILGGILFDSEYLAIVYWYKYCDIKHPEFDKIVHGVYGKPEDRLLYRIFGGEDLKKEKEEKTEEPKK